jgi:hypothetical protein
MIVSREDTGKSDMILEGTGNFFVNENGNVGVFVNRKGIWNVSEREGHRYIVS